MNLLKLFKKKTPPVIIRPPDNVKWTEQNAMVMRALWSEDTGVNLKAIMEGAMYEAIMETAPEEYIEGLRDMYQLIMRHQDDNRNLEEADETDLLDVDELITPTGEAIP